MSMVGKRFTMDGKPLTVTGSYDGDGPDDPPGWYYRHDNDAATHWIRATSVPHRFQPLEEKHE